MKVVPLEIYKGDIEMKIRNTDVTINEIQLKDVLYIEYLSLIVIIFFT